MLFSQLSAHIVIINIIASHPHLYIFHFTVHIHLLLIVANCDGKLPLSNIKMTLGTYYLLYLMQDTVR